jgi:hypothetical protein
MHGTILTSHHEQLLESGSWELGHRPIHVGPAAATINLTFLDTVSSLYGVVGEVAVASTFPILSSAFPAAAAIIKARCEVDAEAAAQVASTLALEYDKMEGSGDDPVLRPFQAWSKSVRLAVKSGWRIVEGGHQTVR